MGGNEDMFNSTETNTGIMLSLQDKANQYIKNGDLLEVAKAGDTPQLGDFNNKMLSLQAGLASYSAEPQIGEVRAPVLFSFIYN